MAKKTPKTLTLRQDNLAKQYYGIDIMKTIMAFLVIMIHRTPFSNELLIFISKNILGRLAVPFFFATAGYLFFCKSQSDGKEGYKKFFKYLKRLIILYIVWSLIYMPAAAYRFDFKTYSVFKFLLNYAKKSVLEVSIIHLWYLLALIIAISLVYILSRKFSFGIILITSLALYAVFLSVTEFSSFTINFSMFSKLQGLVEALPIAGFKNGLFVGFVFVSIGAFSATRNIDFPPSVMLTLTLLSLLLFAAEMIMRRNMGLTSNYDVAVMLVPTTFFFLLLTSNATLKPRKIYSTMRRINSLIYFSHLLIITEWYKLIFTGSVLESLSKTPTFFFSFTVLYTLVFSFAVVWLEKKKHMGFLKYLH